MKYFRSVLLAFAATLATQGALPSVGPDYHRPNTAVAPAYRDLPAGENTWKEATPADALNRGAWWTLFHDSALDELIGRALAANQDLRAAAARVDQARAVAGIARGAYFPTVALTPSFDRDRTSGTTDNAAPARESTLYRGAVDAAWEIDLFGRVRRLNESARADASATAATFESVKLALTAEVATNYFSLRTIDQERGFVAEGIALRRRALQIIGARRTSGTATDFDVARAETELAATEAEAAALENRRAALQNSLAVLVGEVAPAFTLATPDAPLFLPPTVPPGLTSDLLERRPDVAAAERSLAAANARIGVAKAAFFPAISLTGSAGYASNEIDRLFQSSSRLWSIGPSLYLPIFQGGRNRANLARSRAVYEEAVARFRQQVLVAFREVQDGLTATRLLSEQAAAQDRALASARRAGELARKRYDAGFVNYFEIIDAERTVLAAERASAQLTAQRLNNSVFLIKSLGGGWSPDTRVASTP
jgi:multidrug efflux system outer membrane protein